MTTHYYLTLFGPDGSSWRNATDFWDLDEAQRAASQELESGAAVKVHIENAAGDLVKVLLPT